MPSITFIIKQLENCLQLVLLLGKVYPENVLKSLSLRLIFFSNKFSAVAKFLLVSSLPSCFFIGPSADNIVHGALLKQRDVLEVIADRANHPFLFPLSTDKAINSGYKGAYVA